MRLSPLLSEGLRKEEENYLLLHWSTRRSFMGRDKVKFVYLWLGYHHMYAAIFFEITTRNIYHNRDRIMKLVMKPKKKKKKNTAPPQEEITI